MAAIEISPKPSIRLEKQHLIDLLLEAVRDIMRLEDAEIPSRIEWGEGLERFTNALKAARRRLAYRRRVREQLEDELLEQVRATGKAHSAAAESYLETLHQCSDVVNHPDGVHAIHKAAVVERAALEKYVAAVKVLTQLTGYYWRSSPAARASRCITGQKREALR
jgi:hypothetical protein